MNTFDYAHFYTGKTQEQEGLVAGDLNKLLFGLLRCFVQCDIAKYIIN